MSTVTASRMRIPWRRQRRMPLVIVLAFGVLAVVVLWAAIGPLIAPQDPNLQDLTIGATGPSRDHLLGTDDLGRDVLSRLIVGARTSLVGPVVIALGALVLGNVLGVLAGYRGGAIDAVVMRWVDIMYALPPLLIAIVVVGVVGGSYWVAVALLIVLTAPYDVRIIRGTALEQRSRPYVEAAKALGVPESRIMARHIWPNLLPIVVAATFLDFAFSLVNLAALSFLGLGVGVETPDWGRMLADGIPLLFDNPWVSLAPAIMIVLTAASMNLVGDWFYEYLSDRGKTR